MILSLQQIIDDLLCVFLVGQVCNWVVIKSISGIVFCCVVNDRRARHHPVSSLGQIHLPCCPAHGSFVNRFRRIVLIQEVTDDFREFNGTPMGVR
jgi:hypothetical protein